VSRHRSVADLPAVAELVGFHQLGRQRVAAPMTFAPFRVDADLHRRDVTERSRAELIDRPWRALAHEPLPPVDGGELLETELEGRRGFGDLTGVGGHGGPLPVELVARVDCLRD